jgi:hypothetical protein
VRGEVPTFLLTHQHEPHECRYAYAAWEDFASPLRHQAAQSSCLHGGHRVWWTVEAADVAAALAMLPPYVAARSTAEPVRDVPIP